MVSNHPRRLFVDFWLTTRLDGKPSNAGVRARKRAVMSSAEITRTNRVGRQACGS